MSTERSGRDAEDRDLPDECAVLCPPNAHDIEDHGDATVLLKDLDQEIRAIGFSDSGKTVVVANTELHLWNR
jgi:hypothetical protein